MLQKVKTAYTLWYSYYQVLPKIQRYSLGQRIDTLFIEIIEAIATASFLSRQEKLPYVRRAIQKLDALKILLMVLWETKSKSALVDVDSLKEQIRKLKKQEERYNKAYGTGVFDLEQRKSYTTPIREKISQLETQIAQTTSKVSQAQLATPSKQEMERFASKAKEALQGLNFTAKRAIILNTIEKIVGTRQDLQVSGLIPIKQYVKFKSISRHCWFTQRWKIYSL